MSVVAAVAAWTAPLAATSWESSSSDSPVEAVSPEREKNSELLEIWKEHVRTLTRERDEAYRQIDRLKSQQPSRAVPAVSGARAQFGSMEIAPFSPAAGSSPLVQDLRAQILRMQKELQEAKNDRQMRLRDKEKVLRKGDPLELENLRSRNESLQARIRSAELEEQELKDARSFLSEQVDALEKTNQTLRTDLEALRRRGDQWDREKEEAGSRLKVQLAGLEKENDNLRTEIRKLAAANEALRLESAKAEELRGQVQRMGADKEEFQREAARANTLIEKLKAKNTALVSTVEALKSQEAELASYRQKEAEYRSQRERLETFSRRIEALERENTGLESGQAGYRQRIESLESALQANLADLANLKTNFESYMESLQSGFENRLGQK